MRDLKRTAARTLCALLTAAVFVPAANADYYCNLSKNGWRPVDFQLRPNGGTWAAERQQAPRTWEDWIWRGSWEGEWPQCPSNAWGGHCTYNWNQTRSASTTWSVGFSAEPKFKLASSFLGEVTGKFYAQYNHTIGTSQGFNLGVDYGAGQHIEPLIKQNRRWHSGDFVNADVKVGSREGWKTEWNGNRYYAWEVCFNTDPNARFGYWQDNKAEGTPYRSFHIW